MEETTALDKVYEVTARWDNEATVWVAESEDIPGLVAEATTPNELAKKLRVLIPELLELNSALPAGSPTLRFTVRYQYEEGDVVTVAS